MFEQLEDLLEERWAKAKRLFWLSFIAIWFIVSVRDTSYDWSMAGKWNWAAFGQAVFTGLLLLLVALSFFRVVRSRFTEKYGRRT